MIETLNLAAIESSFEIYKNVVHSKDWFVIIFVILAGSMVIPPILEIYNKISFERSSKIISYILIIFAGFLVIMIIMAIDSNSYYIIVEQNIKEHVTSSNCQELLDFITYYRINNPRYMNEMLEVYTENYYFENCGGLNE